MKRAAKTATRAANISLKRAAIAALADTIMNPPC
jgi:hypothetical protein